ncbi:hypothetical protein HDE_04186 [Halotydeus destructor]|nr:hypothetical protein HDE_04186 [Halotydeus destructor]
MFLKPLSLIASVTALISLSLQVRGDVDIITRLCKFQDCFNLDENDARYTGLAYNKKLIQLFSSGISQLLFEDVDKLLISLGSEITPSCVKQLKQVSNSMDLGDEWAFRFLDASGKTPAAFLEGTVSSFGDYDECLDISSHNTDGAISGKYCMVDIFPRRPKKDLTPGRISLATPQHFNASAYYIGLCFPSACTVPDVRVLVKKVLEPFPLLVQGDLHCDTHETNSYLHLAKNIRIGPFISLIFLGCVFTAVAWGSLHHLLKWNDATEMQKGFSVFDNVHKLFYVAPVTGPPRTEFWDWIKNIGIVCGVAAHIMCGLESPIAFFVLSHHKNLEKIISNPAIASLFNEVGLTALTFLSGATTFMLAYPAARKGKLPFVPAILDRILRHLPGVASIIALDFTWYLWFSGPLYSRVGQIHVDKCSKTWWKGILMVSNLWGPSIEICAGHTFFSSVDVQLFILGFIGVKLLASRPKVGSSLLYFHGRNIKILNVLLRCNPFSDTYHYGRQETIHSVSCIQLPFCR